MCPWDHPRVCGEKGVWNAEQARVEGSPPRMRGKVGVPSGIFGFAGITPAYAGKRVRMIFDLYTVGDHPRICGEKFPNIHVPVCRSGSSPHMRGKDCGVADMVLPVRITPAYAGKRRREDGVTFRLEDHPRICGEKIAAQPWAKRRLGSPPHMRGKASMPFPGFRP